MMWTILTAAKTPIMELEEMPLMRALEMANLMKR
jgi:hypothetical protein